MKLISIDAFIGLPSKKTENIKATIQAGNEYWDHLSSKHQEVYKDIAHGTKYSGYSLFLKLFVSLNETQ